MKPLFVLLYLLSICITSTTAQSGRIKYNFNPDWKVYVGDLVDAQEPDFDDHGWKNVTTPYAWNEDDAFRRDIAELSTGIARYRKHFRVPSTSTSKKLFLEFEGIRHGGEFYLNGKSIGRSEDGVMAFGFDITYGVLQDKENVLAARIDSSWDYREKDTNQNYQWSDKNFYANYGGINKNVYLHITDRLYQTLPLYSNLQTTGVYIYAQDFDVSGGSAKITAEAQVKNEYNVSKTFDYRIEIADQGQRIEDCQRLDTVSNLNFWSWGYGYLYNVRTILSVDGVEVDIVTTRTGFRKTEFKNGMFKLNDRTLHLKGYAQRSTNEWAALGSAVPAWLSDFSNQLVLESHGSLIRWMHVTPWKQDVESLDRLGILQAMPAGDSEGDVTGRRWEQRIELMRDAIIYNRNNPSVIFYEGGNEGISEEHQKEMNGIRDKYDPKGGRASGSREMLDSKVAEYGGEMLYINKGSRIPFWQMEYSRDEGLRKYWDEYSPPFHKDGAGPPYKGENASEYNRNQDSHAIENVHRWYDYYEMRPGTGRRVNAGGVNIIFSDSNTHHRGEENYRRSGEVDPVRLPKDGWHAHRVMWDNWVDIEKSATHIIGHWNYASGTVKDVYVVSTADKVELKLNGKILGSGVQSKRFLFTFSKVAYQPGELEAIGYTGNSKSSSDVRFTSGEPAAIKLTSRVSQTGFHANGNDIALVDVEVVDSNGKRCPIALNTIEFNLSGEATWRGGVAQGSDNYILSKKLPVENGINRVLLRSTTKAGQITLEASSSELKSASITLNSKSFESKDGLSTQLPSNGLPSNLSRGPTPRGASFTMKRQALIIVSATAGSNSSSTVASYDDNEETAWSSGSSADTAWIKYKLDRRAKVSQLVLKMVDWRGKTYPLKVSVDDKVAYTGMTPKSLGYVTLDLEPTEGSNVEVPSEVASHIPTSIRYR
ncbi:beta-galactosidase [Zopfia rhizophila CBS 207.26]|uniref:Beta-galactosidase n=1 Tax=Zopfia rhizophila CBS 207.26 TaxID=1314779 RepID=A0A6A6DGS2_9PEZI|nr:beta-galactosidase [Zopfia rhizophila CBS 207.26]